MVHNESGNTEPRENDTGYAGRRVQPEQNWSYTPPGSQVNLNEPIWQAENYNRGAFAGWPNRNWENDRPTSGVWQVRGPYIGQGPKTERQDAFIQEQVSENLSEHPQLDASEITVFVEHGEVTLEGSVDSRWAKRQAEQAADSVAGVKDVHNRLQIAPVAEEGWRRGLAPQPLGTISGAVEPGTGAGRRGGPAGARPAFAGFEGGWRLRPGMYVMGADGHQIGTIKGVRGNDFLVDRNLERDVYVPFQAVQSIQGDRVTLGVTDAGVNARNWPRPPLFGGA
ncbi:MAG TPA: BON domain-containing protein [Thermomicrobiaceae bacterium]|nr:BON domain-containing protein [Thermomicrobiaceae bacterium]HEX5396240.1 BON domain-containing protein [Candidatus Limnocylindria bacterium]